jgi:hypothetical protein
MDRPAVVRGVERVLFTHTFPPSLAVVSERGGDRDLTDDWPSVKGPFYVPGFPFFPFT